LPTHLHHDDVIRACNASIRKLGVKAIDLYQVHWPNKSIPIKETMQAMEKLVRDGKIRYIGVSNFSAQEVREAQEALKENELVSNQVEYSILARDIEKGLLGYCAREKLTVIAYSPLAHGALYDRRHADLIDLLSNIGKKHGKTATQVALNWLIGKDPVMAIPKASTEMHVKELAGAAGWKLAKSDLDMINEFIRHRRHQHHMRWGPLLKKVPAVADLATWLEHRW